MQAHISIQFASMLFFVLSSELGAAVQTETFFLPVRPENGFERNKSFADGLFLGGFIREKRVNDKTLDISIQYIIEGVILCVFYQADRILIF